MFLNLQTLVLLQSYIVFIGQTKYDILQITLSFTNLDCTKRDCLEDLLPCVIDLHSCPEILEWATPLHSATCPVITINMGAVVHFERFPHTQSCCSKEHWFSARGSGPPSGLYDKFCLAFLQHTQNVSGFSSSLLAFVFCNNEWIQSGKFLQPSLVNIFWWPHLIE